MNHELLSKQIQTLQLEVKGIETSTKRATILCHQTRETQTTDQLLCRENFRRVQVAYKAQQSDIKRIIERINILTTAVKHLLETRSAPEDPPEILELITDYMPPVNGLSEGIIEDAIPAQSQSDVETEKEDEDEALDRDPTWSPPRQESSVKRRSHTSNRSGVPNETLDAWIEWINGVREISAALHGEDLGRGILSKMDRFAMRLRTVLGGTGSDKLTKIYEMKFAHIIAIPNWKTLFPCIVQRIHPLDVQLTHIYTTTPDNPQLKRPLQFANWELILPLLNDTARYNAHYCPFLRSTK